MWLSGVTAISNNDDDSASSWKIPLWIFSTAKVFPPAVNYTFQFFMASVVNFMTLSDILYILSCSVGWGCRIQRLLLCKEVRTLSPNECPGYDTKQSDGKVPVMRSTPSLSSLPGPLWSGVVAPDRVLSMSQIELNCVLKLNYLK